MDIHQPMPKTLEDAIAAANLGNPHDIWKLAEMYREAWEQEAPWDPKHDLHQESLRLYKKAADKGHNVSKTRVGIDLLEDQSKIIHEAAMQEITGYLKDSSQEGHGIAQYHLGVAHCRHALARSRTSWGEDNVECMNHAETGLALIQQSAENGYFPAQEAMKKHEQRQVRYVIPVETPRHQRLRQECLSVTREHKRARYLKMAKGGNAPGWVHKEIGTIRPRLPAYDAHLKKAEALFIKEAREGNMESAYALAMMYQDTSLTSRIHPGEDMKPQSFRILKKAADQGHLRCVQTVARWYTNKPTSKRTRTDLIKGAKWATISKKIAESQSINSEGRSELHSKLMELTHQQDKKLLDNLKMIMLPEDWEKSQALAEEWVPMSERYDRAEQTSRQISN